MFIRGGRLVIEEATINPGFVFQLSVPVDPPDGGEVNIQVSDSVNIKGPPPVFSDFSGILTFAGLPVPWRRAAYQYQGVLHIPIRGRTLVQTLDKALEIRRIYQSRPIPWRYEAERP